MLVGPTAPRPSPVLLLLLPSSAGLRSVATGSFVGAAFVCWVAFFWVVDAQIVYLKDSKGKKKTPEQWQPNAFAGIPILSSCLTMRSLSRLVKIPI